MRRCCRGLARAVWSPGGVLAVQMPRQFFAPSHRFLRDIAASMFPDRFDFAHYEPPVRPAVEYCADAGAAWGEVDAWETDYIQRLEPSQGMHPVRGFTASTAMRPFVEKLTATEVAAFRPAYEAALAVGLSVAAAMGPVLFPFRRVFFVLTV